MDKLLFLQLDDYELKLANSKDSENNALAFAVMLKYFQLENRYPKSLSEIDEQLLQTLMNRGSSAQLTFERNLIKMQTL